ncbi:hypothetical protein T12_11530 [Trichinella patagoniensis]|uniref:Uncharacterized protein n=1 Tax=Trichinella patagoniensis TaxID=990121 RepID=A0A0V1A3W4_9BILA|nr:hypothetical protein T12_11530 [Trichinella patagoniensis]
MDTSLYNNNLEIKVSYQTKKKQFACNSQLYQLGADERTFDTLLFGGKKLPLNQRNDSHPLCKQCRAQCSIETGLNLKLEHLFNVIGP